MIDDVIDVGVLDRLLPENRVILSYCVESVPCDHSIEMPVRPRQDNLEAIVAAFDHGWKISSELEEAVVSEQVDEWLQHVEEGKDVGVVTYEPDRGGNSVYIVKDESTDYLFVPPNVSVQRVSQNVLGSNVLGRAFKGTGTIEVLGSLHGEQFREVLQHEINHLLYPHLNEREIREKTRSQVWNPRYH